MPQSLATASDPTQPREARLLGLRHAFFAPGNDPEPWLAGWHPELRAAYREAGTVQVIPRASHALMPEQPAAVAEAIVAGARTLPP